MTLPPAGIDFLFGSTSNVMSAFGWTVNVYVSVHLVSEPTYPYVNVSTHFFSFRTDGFDGQSIAVCALLLFRPVPFGLKPGRILIRLQIGGQREPAAFRADNPFFLA